MTNIKKTHLIYSVISICAICAYGGFLIKNSITEVDVVEETLPRSYSEEFVISPSPTEPYVQVVTPPVTDVPKEIETGFWEAPTESEEATEQVTEGGFYPILPVEGTIIKNYNPSHTYNETTHDWRSHPGIDISASLTDRVVASEDGIVTASYTDPLWGNVIEIDHGEYISVYKNLSTLIMVKEGDSVTKGEAISGVGDKSTSEKYDSPHVHFEMLHYGKYIDPLSLMD